MQHRIGNFYAIRFGPVRGVYLLAACGTCRRCGRVKVGLIHTQTGEQWHRPFCVANPKFLTRAEFHRILDAQQYGVEYVTLGPVTDIQGELPDDASIERTPRRIA